MFIGALIGLMIALIFLFLVYNTGKNEAAKLKKLGFKAEYNADLVGMILIALMLTSIGAVIGYFVS